MNPPTEGAAEALVRVVGGRDLFLGPRHLGQYAELLDRVLAAT